MVGLAGQLCGVLSLYCSKKAGELMASKMLSIPPEQVGKDLSDALGEISNMIAGNFKNKIPGLSEGCMLSVPTVIGGSDYNLHSMADSRILALELLFEQIPIVVSLAVHS
jgi:chemotaxis protein CheX